MGVISITPFTLTFAAAVFNLFWTPAVEKVILELTDDWLQHMPKQESYLELKRGDDSISVLKTYDSAFAKEAFDSMDQVALDALSVSLRLVEEFEPADIPASDSIAYGDFLWEALVDSAQEDGNLRSYFVVELQSVANGQQLAYVSGDWPSAEAFAKLVSQAAPVTG